MGIYVSEYRNGLVMKKDLLMHLYGVNQRTDATPPSERTILIILPDVSFLGAITAFIPFNSKPKEQNFDNSCSFYAQTQESSITLRTLGGVFLHKIIISIVWFIKPGLGG